MQYFRDLTPDALSSANDFTLQQSLAVIGPLFGAGLSGVLAERLGYPVHFMFCGTLVLAIAMFVWLGLREAPGPEGPPNQRSSI